MNKEMFTHTHTHNGISFSHKNKEILPFATIWMDLEDSMLSKINLTKTYTVCSHLYLESKKAELIEIESRMVFTRAG